MIGFTLALHAAAALPAHAQSFAERLETGAFDELRNEAPHDQIVATLNTFFGRPDLNVDLRDITRPSTGCATESANEANAANWILENATEARIVMFNENHYAAEARAFVRQLLGELRSRGFTHIGFEAFSPLTENEADSYTPALGYYTVEPVFAALVRDAKVLGYEVFGYESTVWAPDDATSAERIRVREQGQADNLEKRIGSEADEARFVIFAGWSHIAEEPIAGPAGLPERWMAARLKQATGIDPFTVDLTGCVYAAAEPDGWRGRVYVSEEDGSSLVSGKYAGAVDAQVHLPVAPADHPEAAGFYRSSLGDPVAVPGSLQLEDAPVLVQAYRVDQQPGEVAFDRILLRPGEQLPLYLPPGSYRLAAHRGDGSIVGCATVEVQ